MKSNRSLLFLCCALATGSMAANQQVAVSSAQLNVTNSKTDVLGRHNAKVTSAPVAFVKGVKPTKALAKAYPTEVSMTKTEGIYSIHGETKSYKLNGKSLTERSYKESITKIENADKPRDAFSRHGNDRLPTNDPNTTSYTTTFTTNECAGQSGCMLNVQTDWSPNKWEDIYFLSVPLMMSYGHDLSDVNYFPMVGANGDGIGIHFVEPAAPSEDFVAAGKLKMGGDCSDSYYSPDIAHASNIARLMNTVAPGATLYGYTTSCVDYMNNAEYVPYPVNPYDQNPKIFIGTINNKEQYSGSVYGQDSRYIDELIYNTRIIEFAAAGDRGLDSYNQMLSAAMGTNVITVGAVRSPFDGGMHQTSSFVNPKYRGSKETIVKPEIVNFADFEFPTNYSPVIQNDFVMPPYVTQTASASAFTAATTALLLDKQPFYRWHPEVVKALLLTSGTNKLDIDASSHDRDNGPYYAQRVINAETMASNNRSRFWNGNNTDFFTNTSNKIQFEESGIIAKMTYRIAIAWLSSGDYVFENGKLPQDINLSVYQDGKLIGNSASTSNPFEYVEVTPENNHNLKIVIRRVRNDGGRVLLGYNFHGSTNN